jgi:hypothetical protein
MILESLVLAASLALQTGPGGQAGEPSLHAPFTALLKEHVVNDLVDYDGFAKSPGFPRYLQALATARPEDMSRPDRLAFWINVYNAYTIQLVNLHHERESIRNINMFMGVLRGKGPWKETIVNAGGRTLSLEDVQLKVIRPEFKEPRVNMALVSGALSSPPLRAEAYEGSKLDAQLTDQTRVFLKERQTENRLDLGNSILQLSQIFDWNRVDFGKSDESIIRFVAPYFEGTGERAAFQASRLTIEFTEFDWRLNIQKPRETK